MYYSHCIRYICLQPCAIKCWILPLAPSMRKPSIARRVTDECTDLKASDSVLALEPSQWIRGLNLEIQNSPRKYFLKKCIWFVLIVLLIQKQTHWSQQLRIFLKMDFICCDWTTKFKNKHVYFLISFSKSILYLENVIR